MASRLETLLLSGTYGAGKSSVAVEIADMLEERGAHPEGDRLGLTPKPHVEDGLPTAQLRTGLIASARTHSRSRTRPGLRSIALTSVLVGALAGCGPTTPTSGFTALPGTPSAVASSPPATPAGTILPTPRPSPSRGVADVGIRVIAAGLGAPDGLIAAPDGSGRLFVIDQAGKVLILEHGAVLAQPFLDVGAELVPLNADYDERGLLGVAFDPDFAHSGRVFAYYSARLRRGAAAGQDHTDRLSEFRVSATDPNRVDPTTERTVLQFEQPQPNHDGGGLGFGPDGYLYLGTGDGGSEGDIGRGHSPGGNAQDTSLLNGKILRIDVNGKAPYAIPSTNPFARSGGRPEIYAYGLRNPWRMSWEPAGQHRLLVDDVGWGRYEEVDVVVGGGNYGWPIREGSHCLDAQSPLSDVTVCAIQGKRAEPLIDPVLEYSHAAVGIAIVGGFDYQGSAIAALVGRYVFADFSRDWTTLTPLGRGTLLAATPTAGSAPWSWTKLSIQDAPLLGFVTGIGQDATGEIYLLTRNQLGPTDQTGRILEVIPPG